MRNLTCREISFDKQSLSGTCITESDIAWEQIRSQMQNDLFIVSVKTQRKKQRDGLLLS